MNNSEANQAIDETTGRAEKSEPKITTAFKKIGAAVATYFAVDKIVTFGKTVVGITSSFEDGMLKVQSLSGATQAEYEKLSEAALNYGSSTAWTAKDVADAMGYMALAGFDTNEILESTSGMLSLASASGEDLATVTDILTDSMTGFGDGADQANRYADVLATTQAKSNTTVGALGEAFTYVSSLAGTYSYSLEDVSAALGTMANAGVKGSMAGTSLSSIITRLGTNTSGARDAIEELGVQFYNQDGTARSLGDVLTDLCNATEGMDVAQKAELASTVAGAEAQKGLLAILNQGSGAYTDLQDKLYNCSGAASDMANNMESGLGGSIRSLESAWEGFKIKIGEKIEPGVTAGLDKLTNFVSGTAIPALDQVCDKISDVVGWMKQHEEAVSAVAGALSVAAAAMVAFKAGAMIQSVINSFQQARVAISLYSLSTEGATVAQGLLNGTLTIGEAIVGLLTGKMTLAELAQVGMAKAQAALNAVMTANPIGIVIAAIAALIAIGVLLYKNWDTVKEKLSQLWKSVKDIWGKISATVSQKVNEIKAKVSAAFTVVANAASSIWGKISSAVGEKIDAIKEKATAVFTSIRDTVNSVFETVKNIITVALMTIGEIFSAAFQIISIPWMFIWVNCQDTIISVWNSIKEVVSNAINAVASRVSAKLNEIRAVVLSVLTVVLNTFKTIWNTIKSAVSSVLTAIKNELSRRLNEAKNIVSSILGAIRSVFSSVWNAIKSVVSSVLSSIKAEVSNRLNEAKAIASSVLDAIKSTFSSVWESIKSAVSNAVTAVKNSISNGLNDAKSTVSNVLNSIKDKFKSIFEDVKNVVKNAIEKIKSYFNFSWSLPKLKLPHVSISGKFSLNPPSAPKFKVEWYKKAMQNAMVLNGPTIFGYNPSTGNVMGGGEAGKEVVSGADTLKSMIREAVNTDNGSTDELVKLLRQMLAWMTGGGLEDVLIDVLTNKVKFKLNDREVARLVKAYV